MKYRAWFAVGALVGSTSAHAINTLQLTGFSFEPRGVLTNPYTDIASNFITTISVDGSMPVPPPAGSYVGGGQMAGTFNSQSFLAYCVEISILVSFGPVYTDYTLVSGAVGFGTRAAHLASLMTWASAAGMPSDAAQSAALQAAVWEVVHETTGGPYSFTGGKLKTTSQSATTQAALNNIQANWSTILTTAPAYTVSRLDGGTQDLLTFAPVPEAGTLAMMVVGLAGVAAARRRPHQV